MLPNTGRFPGDVSRGNDVSVETNQGIKDGELVKAFRATNIANRYMFKGDVILQTATVDFVTHLELGLVGVKFRGKCPSYMRQIDRQLRNESNEMNSRWGFAYTYDRALGIPHPCRNNDIDRRNGTGRTYHRMDRYGRRGVNCAFGDEVYDEEDNADYFEGDRDNFDYEGDHSQGEVNFAANGDNYSSSALALDEIGRRNTDTDVEAYLSNRIVADEYRDAERAEDCDVFKTFAKNIAR